MLYASVLIENYDNSLNEEGVINIGTQYFYRSDILKKCDPVAYKVGFFRYLDSMGIDIDSIVIEWDTERM